MIVRHARESEAPALADLVRRAYAHYVDRMGKKPAPMTEDYAALIRAGSVRVAEHEGTLLGLLVLTKHTNHVALDNIAVSPDAQGSGIGAQLLEFTENYAREHELREIRLHTNEAMTENITYYTRRGYVETGRAIDRGYRRVFFTKHLRDPVD